MDILKADKMRQMALDCRSNGDFKSCLNLLRSGFVEFPEYADEYNHAVFSKEIVRTLLMSRRYSDALVELFELKLDINEHATLFARAYEKDENIEAARAWWLRVAEKTPGNSECSKFFNDHPPQPTFAVGVGSDQLVDIKKYFPNFEFQVIFDVGSNVGQSLENYLNLSSGCLVHCFEPSPDSYNQLCQRFDAEPRAILNNLALSNKIGELLFNMSGTSTMNRVGDAVSGNIAVPTLTIDAYCQTNKINAIDYLKIDTEGHELNVLSGAKEILHDVAFVELEASMNPYNRYHTQYKDICDFMFGNDFYLFGLYELVREWGGGGLPMIRRANPVFFNKKLVGSLPAGLITR